MVRRLAVLLACGALLAAGCGGEGGGSGHPGGDCAMAVRFHGHLYWGRLVEEKLDLGGALGAGVIPRCQDNEGASSDEPVHLRAIRGVNSRTAIANAEQPRVVYLYDPKAKLPAGLTAVAGG